MKDLLSDSQKLWWIDRKNWTEGYITVLRKEEDCFVFEYNGERYGFRYSVIGKRLFLEPQLAKIRNCDNCFRRYAGDCTSLSGQVCEDFVVRQKISQEEMDAWPEYGDATAFKLRDYSRFKK